MSNNSLKYLWEETCEELNNNIGNNLDRYLNGDFSDILQQTGTVNETDKSFDSDKLAKINKTIRHNSKCDGLNSFRVYSAMPELPKNYATHPGIWVKLCHDECLQYARGRWLNSSKSDEELIRGIKKHFFVSGRTGYRDDNAIGRLWWTGAIIKNIDKKLKPGSKELCRKINIVFKFAQSRQSTVERARIFNQTGLAYGIIKYMESGNLTGERDTREFMKKVNSNASGLVLGVLNKNELDQFISDCDF